jgi:metal-responsive CopG/Arc/MetJ family transcriptional regulator
MRRPRVSVILPPKILWGVSKIVSETGDPPSRVIARIVGKYLEENDYLDDWNEVEVRVHEYLKEHDKEYWSTDDAIELVTRAKRTPTR